MKKITSLLMMLCMFVGAVNAEVTKYYKPGERLSTLTEGQKVMFYNTCLPDGQDRTGFLIDNAGWFALNKQKPSATPIFSEKVGVWTLQNVRNTEGVYTVNVKGANGYVGIGGKTNNGSAQVLRFQEWTAAADNKKAGVNSENAAGTKVNNADISAEDKVWLVTNADQSTTWNGNQDSFTTWSTGHPYAVYSVVEATTAELQAMLDAAKTAAVTELNDLKKLSVIFTTAEAAIASVNAVALENDDLETALNTINTLVANVKAEVNGKNVKFCNKATDGRGGRYLGYDVANSRFAALMDDDDNVVWTLKSTGNGVFKLYNAANNVWLGQPDKPAGAVANENNAVVYKFVITAENEACLVPNGTRKMVHVNNSAGDNYPIMNHYSTTDAASLWDVTVLSNKAVTNQAYTTFTSSKKVILDGMIPYAKQLQESYGLVKDGANIEVVINHPDGSDNQPSSNLFDGNNATFVHSSYATGANAVAHHYIKAHLSEAKQKVFFYLSKRDNNNRPLKVNVYASNDGENFPTTPAATMIMTESKDNSIQSYFTEAVDLGAAYEYLKFEVVNTNGGTQFFTLSEFYILPVLEETTKKLSDLTSTSVFANNADACLDAANVYYSSYKTPELKAEIQAFLDANEDKIAAMDAVKPSLGQYPYSYYAELDIALEEPNILAGDLQNAFEVFKKSKNVPVFMITGIKNYVQGKSIFDDGVDAPGFKTTNAFDKTMWWALDLPSTTVGVAENVNIYNVGTGNGFWGASSIRITETNENDGAGIADDGLFLFYIDNQTHPMHYQEANSTIVSYWSYEATSGSAHKFFYIGNSYDLAELSDELFTAAAELADVTVPNFSFAPGVNNYNAATKPALDEAIANRTTVLSKLSTAEELAAAKTQLETAIAGVQINMPEDGKFYRLRCTGTDMKYLQYTQNTDANRFDMISGNAGGKTVNATFCYTGGGLVSYVKPMYINHDDNVASFKMNKTTVKFSEATNVTGQYFINVGGRYIYGESNKSDSGAGSPNNDKGYRWWLEVVTELPISITAAGYATFYAPCNITLPDGLKAYTVAVNGGWATLNEIEGKVIPANTGVVLEGAEGDYTLTVGGEPTAVVGSDLHGTVADTYVTDAAYVLGYINVAEEGQPEDMQVGFYTATKNQQGNTSWLNNGFKAYLPKTDKAETLRFNFGGNTTAIESVLNNGVDANAPIYDLSGRRVNNAVKGGIYIQNGKKFIVK